MLAKSSLAAALCLGQLALALPQPQSSSSGNDTSIADLVKDVEPCVLKCIRDAAPQVNCQSDDLSCLCSKNPQEFRELLQPCVLSGCEDLSIAIRKLPTLSPPPRLTLTDLCRAEAPPKISKVCDRVKDDPSQDELKAASEALAGDDSEKTNGGSNSEGGGSDSGDGDDEGAAAGLAANGLLVAIVALLLL
jgi:hypothetical protein